MGFCEACFDRLDDQGRKWAEAEDHRNPMKGGLLTMKRVLPFVALTAANAGAVNPVAAPQPAQDETKNARVFQDNAAELSEQDRSLACPAELGCPL